MLLHACRGGRRPNIFSLSDVSASQVSGVLDSPAENVPPSLEMRHRGMPQTHQCGTFVNMSCPSLDYFKHPAKEGSRRQFITILLLLKFEVNQKKKLKKKSSDD